MDEFNLDDLASNISVCCNCNTHTNDDMGETQFSLDGDPYCKPCFISTGELEKLDQYNYAS